MIRIFVIFAPTYVAIMMIILTISHYWTFARNYPNFIAVPVLLVGFFVFLEVFRTQEVAKAI